MHIKLHIYYFKGVREMNINLSDTEVLLLLDSVLDNHKRCEECCEPELVIDRKSLQDLYNKILMEAQDNGMASMLKPIGNIAN